MAGWMRPWRPPVGGNVFTTHTPVDAGFDRFAPDLVSAQLGAYARDELGLSLDELLALGRAHPTDRYEPFNTAWLAARCSGAINAVSRRFTLPSARAHLPTTLPTLSGARSAHRLRDQRRPCAELGFGGSRRALDRGVRVSEPLARSHGGRGRTDRGEVRRSNSGKELRRTARGRLVSFVRERLSEQLAASGLEGGVPRTRRPEAFDPDAQAIRVSPAAPPNTARTSFLLRDEDRLARLVTNRSRPVQIVVAGKAHPQDAAGKDLVCQWVRFARRADVRLRVVFVADYDLRLAERLVQGVDLWVNTPRPPWEACGTSGMKGPGETCGRTCPFSTAGGTRRTVRTWAGLQTATVATTRETPAGSTRF